MTGGETLALDVGGSRIKAARVDGSGRVAGLTVVGTPAGGAAALGECLTGLARSVYPDRPERAVGLAFPGLVDPDGRLLALPGKHDGLAGTDLRGWLGELFGAGRYVVVNDAVAYGVGEAQLGAGANDRRVVVVTLGSGVGVCACEDAVPLGSAPFGAGVLAGQIPIADPLTGPVDSNGQRGTIEALCAAGRLTSLAAGAGYPDIPALARAVGAGEPAAEAVLAGYQRDLLQGITALAQAYGPSAIVVGGGPVADGWLLAGLQDRLAARLWPGHVVKVLPARLGDAAALAGLGLLAARGYAR